MTSIDTLNDAQNEQEIQPDLWRKQQINEQRAGIVQALSERSTIKIFTRGAIIEVLRQIDVYRATIRRVWKQAWEKEQVKTFSWTLQVRSRILVANRRNFNSSYRLFQMFFKSTKNCKIYVRCIGYSSCNVGRTIKKRPAPLLYDCCEFLLHGAKCARKT